MKINLMPIKEYAETKHKIPYIYKIKKEDKTLLVLGSNHSNNPKDPQFSLFKKKFKDFKPEVIFVEGGAEKAEWVKRFRREKEVIKRGESAFLTFLGKKNNIPVLSWEPEDKEKIEILLKKYTKEEFFALYMLDLMPQYVRYKKPRGYLQKWIRHFQSVTKWKGFDYSLDNLKRIHKKIFNKNMKFDDEELYSIAPYPVESKGFMGNSILNKIAADEMKLRDTFAVKKINKSFKKYDKVLAIMGSGHAVVQEPAYRDLLK